MNAERLRQAAEAKVRRARIDAGAAQLKCRAIPAEHIFGEVKLLRKKPLPRKPTPAVEAIEAEHRVRVQCVVAVYEAECARHRAVFADTMADCRAREMADLKELDAYRLDLLADLKTGGSA